MELKVLGTFILEWDEGRTIANELLSTKESAHLYAERLAELVSALGFDGWLVYIFFYQVYIFQFSSSFLQFYQLHGAIYF